MSKRAMVRFAAESAGADRRFSFDTADRRDGCRQVLAAMRSICRRTSASDISSFQPGFQRRFAGADVVNLPPVQGHRDH